MTGAPFELRSRRAAIVSHREPPGALTTGTSDRTTRHLGTLRRPGGSRPSHESSNHGTPASRPGTRKRQALISDRPSSAPSHAPGRYRPGAFACPRQRNGFERQPGRCGRDGPDDPTLIEIGLDDAGRIDEVRVVIDRARDPIDVRGLERRDLAEAVVVELAELRRRPRASSSGTSPDGRWMQRDCSTTSGPVGCEARGGSRWARVVAARRLAAQHAGRAVGRRSPGCAAGTSGSCRPGRSPAGSASGAAVDRGAPRPASSAAQSVPVPPVARSTRHPLAAPSDAPSARVRPRTRR